MTTELKVIRTVEITTADGDRRTITVYHCEDRGYLLHDSNDVNFDNLEQMQDDSDTSIMDLVGDNGFEIVEAEAE